MRYILALTARATINGNPQGVGYEFDADDAMRTHFVDRLKIARTIAEIDGGGKVSTVRAEAEAEAVDLDSLKYNELRQLAASMDLDTAGKSDLIRERIAAARAAGE